MMLLGCFGSSLSTPRAHPPLAAGCSIHLALLAVPFSNHSSAMCPQHSLSDDNRRQYEVYEVHLQTENGIQTSATLYSKLC